MHETSKLNWYRKDKGYDAYFIGKGIDIGCGDDVLNKQIWDNITELMPYDKSQGNAQYVANVSDNTFNFVYSSHCLEDLDDPYEALSHWIRICNLEGYLIIAVPDEEFYERFLWPSIFNPDHKHSFTLNDHSDLPCSINVINMINNFTDCVEVISCDRIIRNFDTKKRIQEDQTLDKAVCQIEFILKKKTNQVKIKKFTHPKRDLDKIPPYVHPQKLSLILSYSALGDFICAIPIVKKLIADARLHKVLVYPNRLPLLDVVNIPSEFIHVMNEYTPMPFNPEGSFVRDILEHADITAPFNIHLQDYASFNACSAILKPQDKNIVCADINKLPNNPMKNKKYFVVSPTYMLDSRRMSPSIFSSIKQHIISLGYDVVILGGDPSPHRKINGINDYDFTDCTDLINKTTLIESISILKDAIAVITMDSGLVYLAAMTNVPIIAGYTIVDPYYRLPWRHNELGWQCVAIESHNACRYCTSILSSYRAFDLVCPNYSDFKCVDGLKDIDFISAINKKIGEDNGSMEAGYR